VAFDETAVVMNLASTQIDSTGLIGLPEETRKRPLLAFKTFATISAAPSVHRCRCGLGSASIRDPCGLGPAAGQRRGLADADSWNLDVLDFRAPGATQVG